MQRLARSVILGIRQFKQCSQKKMVRRSSTSSWLWGIPPQAYDNQKPDQSSHNRATSDVERCTIPHVEKYDQLMHMIHAQDPDLKVPVRPEEARGLFHATKTKLLCQRKSIWCSLDLEKRRQQLKTLQQERQHLKFSCHCIGYLCTCWQKPRLRSTKCDEIFGFHWYKKHSSNHTHPTLQT